MIANPAASSLPRLTRWTLVLAAALLSMAVLGATSARPNPPVATIAPDTAMAQTTPHPPELMHDDLMAAAPLSTASLDSHQKVIWMEVTAYCGCPKCCGPHARGLTASGRSVAYNGGQFVAADKKLFKFGTQFQIPGYANGQPVEVIDRGGAIKGFHLDVFFPNHDQAKAWGRKWMAVTVVE
jgi:3D (Asp-Asp-Asp) domain-containing protein